MRIRPSTFVSITWRSSSSLDSQTGSRPSARPALLKRMSRPPSSASARSTNARELSGSVTSRRAVTARADEDAGTGLFERPRGRRADPARGARDDRALACQGGHRREVNAHPTTRSARGRLGLGDAASGGERPAQYQADDRRRGAPGAARRGGVREPQRARSRVPGSADAALRQLRVHALPDRVRARDPRRRIRVPDPGAGRAGRPQELQVARSSRTSRRCSSSASSRSWSST